MAGGFSMGELLGDINQNLDQYCPAGTVSKSTDPFPDGTGGICIVVTCFGPYKFPMQNILKTP